MGRSLSCIEAVQNSAVRFCLGVGRYTPAAAVSSVMGWMPCILRQWKSIFILWSRFSAMSSGRNKNVYLITP